MGSLRSFTTIQTNKEIKAEKDLRYTLVPGETKKNYCKIMTNVRLSTGDRPFTFDFVKKMVMKYARNRTDRHFRSGDVRTERVNLSDEEANSLLNELLRQGYIKYVTTVKRDKLHPNIPEDGLKYYIFDKFKVIECEESKYFQQQQHKKTEQVETKGTLNERRCRALRQIYAQFGDKVPFTYEMVQNIPKFYKKMAEDKTQEISDESRVYYRAAAQYSETKSTDFLDTWNSLIRNNFLVPYKIRTKEGIIKIRQGAYKVNMTYARRCLSEINL